MFIYYFIIGIILYMIIWVEEFIVILVLGIKGIKSSENIKADINNYWWKNKCYKKNLLKTETGQQIWSLILEDLIHSWMCEIPSEKLETLLGQ